MSTTESIEEPALALPVTIHSTLLDDDLDDLIAEFVAEMPTRIKTLEDALASGNRPELLRAVHQLSGAGGSYGFGLLSQHARALEGRIREGAAFPEVLPAFGELTEICRRLRPGRPPAA
jgi:HPt (histidine-containing phosphotransfer) domain-containing protein